MGRDRAVKERKRQGEIKRGEREGRRVEGCEMLLCVCACALLAGLAALFPYYLINTLLLKTRILLSSLLSLPPTISLLLSYTLSLLSLLFSLHLTLLLSPTLSLSLIRQRRCVRTDV